MTGGHFQLALLTANGAEEAAMANIGRGLAVAKLSAKTISPENALLMTWSGKGWGLSYPVDARLETSLGSDFDGLIIPDGQRAVEKLLTNPHTKRFVNAFFMANRPIVAFGTGATLFEKLELTGDNVMILADLNEASLAQAVAHLVNWANTQQNEEAQAKAA